MSAPARPVTPLGILAAELDRVRTHLAAVDPALAAELDGACALASGLDPYLAACAAPESPALAALAERTRTAEWGGALEQEMLSGHVEGRVLAFLVRLTGARRVLDVGMFTGYSSLAMAEALPAGGEVVACELDPGVAAFARESFAASAAGARITVHVAPAAETLRTLEGPFDLVFLDAEKPGYLGYVELLLERDLLAGGGLLCVDNTLMQGEPWLPGPPSPNGAAIAAFNTAIAADPRLEQVLLPLRDGLTLIRRC